jgi:hypothetical protein
VWYRQRLSGSCESKFRIARVFALRRKDQKVIFSGLRPDGRNRSSRISSVITWICRTFQADQLSLRNVFATASAVFSMYWRSGSFVAVSGVGTQIMMQSASASRLKSDVASNCFLSVRSAGVRPEYAGYTIRRRSVFEP